jgi:hypothetical protein
MGWSLTYSVKLKRPLTREEQVALDGWSRDSRLRLASTRGDAFEAWRGLLPDARIEELKASERKYAVAPGADFGGFLQVRTEAHFKRLVRSFQQLEALLPVAEVRLTDDFYLKDERPSDVDLSEPLSPRMDEPDVSSLPASPDTADASDSDPLVNEVATALKRAQRDFELWRKSKPK